MGTIIENLDAVRLGDPNYNALTGMRNFLIITAGAILVLLCGAYLSPGSLRWALSIFALVPAWFFFINLKNRLQGIWHRHYYPLMYLWSGASGAVTGLTESGEFAGISKDDFEPVSAFFLGLAFPKGPTEDYMKLVGLTEIPLFQYYVDFGVLNPDSNSDDPRQLETERFCKEQEAANPNLFRRVKLFALIIFKQVGREGAARFLANWGALV